MDIQRRKPLTAKVGVLSVGHKTYWGQFEGLLQEMRKKTDLFIGKLEANEVEVEDFGMADDSPGAFEALLRIRSSDIDLLFIDMVTYAPSCTFAPLVRELTVPIVLVALQPLPAMDYAHAKTFTQLCNDDICAVPEFCNTAVRMGKKAPETIIGKLTGDEEADAEVQEWCRIAKVLHSLHGARIGHMGHVLESMYDMQTDPVAVSRAFGVHVVQCEPDEIMKHYRQVPEEAVETMKERILQFFDTPDPVSDPVTEKVTDKDLYTASKAAVALNAFVEEKKLDGFAYYYESQPDTEMRTLVTNMIVGNSLLCAEGFPMCGEFDIKTCIAMMIMDRLEIGGSFAELHPMDFTRDSILVGHDGPHHLSIADRKPAIRSLREFHGKPGKGASVEFSIKEGPITILCNTIDSEGRFKFVIAEGESVHLPVPPTGNTNTLGHFDPDLKTFLRKWIAEGPTHHFALGIGHHAGTLKKIADCLGIEAVIVTE